MTWFLKKCSLSADRRDVDEELAKAILFKCEMVKIRQGTAFFCCCLLLLAIARTKTIIKQRAPVQWIADPIFGINYITIARPSQYIWTGHKIQLPGDQLQKPSYSTALTRFTFFRGSFFSVVFFLFFLILIKYNIK